MKKRSTGTIKYNQSPDWFNPKKAGVYVVETRGYKDSYGLIVHDVYSGEVPIAMNLKKGDRVSFTPVLGKGIFDEGTRYAKAIKKI